MNKLKTLKDLEKKGFSYHQNNSSITYILQGAIGIKELKQLVIKWVKEDIEDCSYHVEEVLINKWKKRLNITEEDLK